MKLDFDVVIIGAGVAGMTSALYLKRSGIRCCIIEKYIPGGQINLSPSVENYPGFINISGTDCCCRKKAKEIRSSWIK